MNDLVVISNVCVAEGCRRRPVVARKLSDFWVSTCEPCSAKKVTLDFDKITRATKATEKLT